MVVVVAVDVVAEEDVVEGYMFITHMASLLAKTIFIKKGL